MEQEQEIEIAEMSMEQQLLTSIVPCQKSQWIMKLAIRMIAQVAHQLDQQIVLKCVDGKQRSDFFILCFFTFFHLLIRFKKYFRMVILEFLDRLFSELWKWHQNEK